MTPRCDLRDDRRDETDWVCYMPLAHEGKCRPRLSDEGLAFILAADNYGDALFELADAFRVPLTNNGVTWCEDGDPSRPVFCVSDFIAAAQAVNEKFGGKK